VTDTTREISIICLMTLCALTLPSSFPNNKVFNRGGFGLGNKYLGYTTYWISPGTFWLPSTY
jgi:hypothetical protein